MWLLGVSCDHYPIDWVQRWVKHILERDLFLEIWSHLISILVADSASSSSTLGISCSLQWSPLQWQPSTCSWLKYHQIQAQAQ